MSRRTIDSFLNLGLNNPNPLVRAMSLKGLSSSLMQPQKVRREQGGGFREEGGAVEKSLRSRSPRKGWMRKARQAGAGRGIGEGWGHPAALRSAAGPRLSGPQGAQRL